MFDPIWFFHVFISFLVLFSKKKRKIWVNFPWFVLYILVGKRCFKNSRKTEQKYVNIYKLKSLFNLVCDIGVTKRLNWVKNYEKIKEDTEFRYSCGGGRGYPGLIFK